MTLYVAGKEEALHQQLLFGIGRGHLVFRGSGFGNLLFHVFSTGAGGIFLSIFRDLAWRAALLSWQLSSCGLAYLA